MAQKILLRSLFISCIIIQTAFSAFVPVGSGGYTTTFPGTDIAGRNGYPSGTPQVTGAAVGRPIPTNDWWSALLKNDHAVNLFNYPMAMRTLPSGLDLGLIVPTSTPNGSSQPLSDQTPIIVGVSGLAAPRATVDDYSDWTVTIAWASGAHSFKATSGIAMPFVYFTKATADTASVQVNQGTATINNELLLVTNSQGGSNFAFYAPTGSTWNQSGSTFTSDLNGKNYWSVAFIPGSAASVLSKANAWKTYAYVFPEETKISWNYDEATAIQRTEYTTTISVKEGIGNQILQGLLPHQWSKISSDSPALTGDSFSSIRGEVKLMASNQFSTTSIFHGILPTLPALAVRSEGFDPAALHDKIGSIENDALATWTDSYNEGQVMNRLIQTARIAHEMGDIEARDKMIATIRERLEDWLTAESGEVAFLFYYQPTWNALIGYPAGHGQDTNINDHHFHWGYFIHAAAFLEQFEPGWADQWGDMINLLVRDAASPDRNDSLFPFLRNFSPYAGHSWANGFATFPFGNDQESTSESMQFNSSLIHWGSVTGNKEIRDLGIYLYTTEQAAIEEYWFDQNKRTFKQGYGYSVASRIWGNGYDNQTFWTGDIAAAYGIELYPIHGGSLYLGHNIAYATNLWNEMAKNTGILSQAVNDNLWHDVYWEYLAFTDPAKAIELYNGNPNRSLKFGISDAQTYYWLHAMNALGQIDISVTANDPLAVVFSKNGDKTYTAHNYTDAPKTIVFSDGAQLTVPAKSMGTSKDLPLSGTITTAFNEVPAGTSIVLNLELSGDLSGLVAVQFYDGAQPMATLTEGPYTLKTPALNPGKHSFSARLYAGELFTVTRLVSVIVGQQYPYNGIPQSLPGTLEAGLFDRFEGGNAQDIAYHDASPGNNGDFRTSEDVDITDNFVEGAVVGWVSDKEWLEYTVEVEKNGLYDLSVRYASGNSAGGGPFYFERDGERISDDFSVATSSGWETFATAQFTGVELREGVQVIRLNFHQGEMNLGRMTFSFAGDLPYAPPVASAGNNFNISSPTETASLDGSGSFSPDDKSLTYAWTQLFGPTVVQFDDASLPSPFVSGLNEDGLYRFKLTISDGDYSASDEIDIFRGEQTLRPPSVSIISPSVNSNAIAGQPLTIETIANDPDGEVVRVDILVNAVLLTSVETAPYSVDWFPPEGAHTISARVKDNDGLSSESGLVTVNVAAPTSCTGTAKTGDFHYTFSPDKENPTITFIPGRTGVGSNIVILYYGTGGGPFPGYIISPNTPYQLNAAEGQRINFYFTYSVPEGGERNSLADLKSYTVGTCAEPPESDPAIALIRWQETFFSNSELQNNSLESTLWGNSADPDNDGLSNYIEFMTGSDPRALSPAALKLEYSEFDQQWHVRFNRRAGLPSEILTVDFSTDLTIWQSATTTEKTISMQNGIEHIAANVSQLTSPESGKVYLRLSAIP